MNSRLLVFLSFVTALPAAAENSAGRSIDVDEAVRLAMESPGLQAARERSAAADSQANSVRGHLLPSVHVDDEFLHYNSKFSIAFPLGPSPIAFTARQQNTNTFVVAAGQPLLGLIHLGFDFSSLRANADSATENEKAIEASVREAIQTGYLRYFEYKALIEITQSSQQQLEEQHQVAQSKVRVGTLTKADLLRLEVAKANAKQQEIEAKVGADNTRTSLLLAMGLNSNDPSLNLVQPTKLEQASVPQISETEAQRLASDSRHEVIGARLQETAAGRASTSKLFQMLPEVNAEAAYVNITGQTFAQPSAGYVGVKASWNIWSWGADYFAYRQAEHQARAAKLMADDQVRQVKQEVSTRLSAAHAAAAALDLAQATIASAEEAYRVMEALVKVGSATTTDLLDSQSALTQARLNLVRAKAEQSIATVAYQHAVGN